MSNNQRETLQDRLAKRKQIRNRRFLNKDFVDESEISLINKCPTTQSLDRFSSKRITNQSPMITNISSEQSKASSLSITTKISDLPPIQQSFLKENYLLSDEKRSSAPILSQEKKSQSIEINDEKQTSTKSLSDNNKSVISQEKKSQSMENNDEKPTSDKSLSDNSKPVIIPETKPITLPPLDPEKPNETSFNSKDEPTAFKKLSAPPRMSSIPQTSSNVSQTYNFNHSSSNPESATSQQQQKHFHYPSFHSNPIVRIASEEIVSAVKFKHIPLNSSFAKQNSLALPYLFTKRLIETEFARGTSLDSADTQQKTVWD